MYQLYWNKIFKGKTLFESSDLRVIYNKDLRSNRSLILLFKDEMLNVALNDEHFDVIQGFNLKDAQSFRDDLNHVGLFFHPGDHLYYLDQNDSSILIESIPLDRSFETMYEDFRSRVPFEEFDEAFVELDHHSVYAYLMDGKIVGAASTYLWDDSKIADIGVVVDPKYRGRGIAKDLVSALVKDSLKNSYVPQYRHNNQNIQSSLLAKSLGFKHYGYLEIIKK